MTLIPESGAYYLSDGILSVHISRGTSESSSLTSIQIDSDMVIDLSGPGEIDGFELMIPRSHWRTVEYVGFPRDAPLARLRVLSPVYATVNVALNVISSRSQDSIYISWSEAGDREAVRIASGVSCAVSCGKMIGVWITGIQYDPWGEKESQWLNAHGYNTAS